MQFWLDERDARTALRQAVQLRRAISVRDSIARTKTAFSGFANANAPGTAHES
jgi:hypothetical protein